MLFHLNSGKTLDLTPDEYAEMKKKIRCFEIIEACRAVINSGTFTEEGGKYGDIQILLGDKELEEIADKALDTIKDNFLSDTMPFVRETMDKWYRKNERRCKPYVIAVTGTVRVNCPECMPVEKANQKLFEVVSKNTFEPLVCIKMMELPPVDKKDGTIDYGAMVSGLLYVKGVSMEVVNAYTKSLTVTPLEDISIEVQQWPAIAPNLLNSVPKSLQSTEKPTRLKLTVRVGLSTFEKVPNENLIDNAKSKVLLAAEDYISDVGGKIVDSFIDQDGRIVSTVEVSAYTYLDGSIKANPETVPEIFGAVRYNRLDKKCKVRISVDPVDTPKKEPKKTPAQKEDSLKTAYTAAVTGYLTFGVPSSRNAEYEMEREDLGPLQSITWDIFPGCERDIWIAHVNGYVVVYAESEEEANTMVSEMDFNGLRDIDWKFLED